MATITQIAYAPIITFERAAGGGRGAFYAICPSGQHVGYVQVIRGFAHYTGTAHGVHAGFHAVVKADPGGTLEGLRSELAKGLRNGRDDSR